MICKKCNKDKPKYEFYRHEQMKTGFLSFCKSCKKEDSKIYRYKNIEKVREYDRNRPNQSDRSEKAKKSSWKYADKRTEYNRRWREKNKIKMTAHSKVRLALKAGKITKKPCAKCGNIKTEAHHTDYSKPLDVIWLCPKHHGEWHKMNRREK